MIILIVLILATLLSSTTAVPCYQATASDASLLTSGLSASTNCNSSGVECSLIGSDCHVVTVPSLSFGSTMTGVVGMPFLSRIDGRLLVSSSSITGLSFPRLRQVGSISVSGNNQLAQLEFPALVVASSNVANQILIHSNALLESVSFPLLETINASLASYKYAGLLVTSNPVLTSLSMPGVTGSDTFSLNLDRNPRLSHANILQSLVTVKELTISDNGFTNLTMSNLVSVVAAQGFKIYLEDGLETVSFPKLESLVLDNIVLSDKMNLTVVDFPVLRQVQSISLIRCPKVKQLEFPALVVASSNVANQILIHSNALLESVSFPLLETINASLASYKYAGLLVTSNPVLTSLSMPGVTGSDIFSLNFDKNPRLSHANILQSLVTVKELTISGNGFTNLTMSNLVSVVAAQSFLISGEVGLETVSFPRLESLALNKVIFVNRLNLTAVHFPVLRLVDYISVTGCPKLKQLEFPALVVVSSNAANQIVIHSNDVLESVSFPLLETINASLASYKYAGLSVTSNPVLASLSMPKVTGSDILDVSLSSVESISLCSVTTLKSLALSSFITARFDSLRNVSGSAVISGASVFICPEVSWGSLNTFIGRTFFNVSCCCCGDSGSSTSTTSSPASLSASSLMSTSSSMTPTVTTTLDSTSLTKSSTQTDPPTSSGALGTSSVSTSNPAGPGNCLNSKTPPIQVLRADYYGSFPSDHEPKIVRSQTVSFCLESDAEVRLQSEATGEAGLYADDMFVVSVDDRPISVYGFYHYGPYYTSRVIAAFGTYTPWGYGPGTNSGPAIPLGLLSSGNHVVKIGLAQTGPGRTSSSAVHIVAEHSSVATSTTATIAPLATSTTTVPSSVVTTIPGHPSIWLNSTQTTIVIIIIFSGDLQPTQVSAVIVLLIQLSQVPNIQIISPSARATGSQVSFTVSGTNAGLAASNIIDALAVDPSYMQQQDPALPLVDSVGVQDSLNTTDGQSSGSFQTFSLTTDPLCMATNQIVFQSSEHRPAGCFSSYCSSVAGGLYSTYTCSTALPSVPNVPATWWTHSVFSSSDCRSGLLGWEVGVSGQTSCYGGVQALCSETGVTLLQYGSTPCIDSPPVLKTSYSSTCTAVNSRYHVAACLKPRSSMAGALTVTFILCLGIMGSVLLLL